MKSRNVKKFGVILASTVLLGSIPVLLPGFVDENTVYAESTETVSYTIQQPKTVTIRHILTHPIDGAMQRTLEESTITLKPGEVYEIDFRKHERYEHIEGPKRISYDNVKDGDGIAIFYQYKGRNRQETRRVTVIYQNATDAYMFGRGTDIELKDGENYTFVAPKVEGYEFLGVDYAEAHYWTFGAIRDGIKESLYHKDVKNLTLSYNDITPVVEDGMTHVPILYVQYRPVTLKEDDTNSEKPNTATDEVIYKNYIIARDRLLTALKLANSINPKSYTEESYNAAYSSLISSGTKETIPTLLNHYKEVLNGAKTLDDNVGTEESPYGWMTEVYHSDANILEQAIVGLVQIQSSNDSNTSDNTNSSTSQTSNILSNTDQSIFVKVEGEDVATISSIKTSKVTDEVILSKLPANIKSINVAMYDIKMLDNKGNIINITNEATVTLPVDGTRKVTKVIYFLPQTGAIEELPFTLSEDGKSVSFKVSHFSNYGIVYEDNTENKGDTTDSKTNTSSNTSGNDKKPNQISNNQSSQGVDEKTNGVGSSPAHKKTTSTTSNNSSKPKDKDNSSKTTLPKTGEANSKVTLVGLMMLFTSIFSYRRYRKEK